MSTSTVTTRVTHSYLMNKTKYELASMVLDLMKEQEQEMNNLNSAFTKAENDTADMFGCEFFGMKTKTNDRGCPICYFRERVKYYLGYIES